MRNVRFIKASLFDTQFFRERVGPFIINQLITCIQRFLFFVFFSPLLPCYRITTRCLHHIQLRQMGLLLQCGSFDFTRMQCGFRYNKLKIDSRKVFKKYNALFQDLFV